MNDQGMMSLLHACGEASIYVMGMSFVVGSLTTIFVLVLLDMYRSRSVEDSTSAD